MLRIAPRVRLIAVVRLLVLASFAASADARAAGDPAAAAPVMTLEVDATEAPRRVFHARLTIPARPGPVTLVYPKWLPGTHGPTGPVHALAGLKVAAAGRAVPWRRDPDDAYAFHVEVPAGAEALDVRLDFLGGRGRGWAASWHTNCSTEKLAILNWNCFLLYPRGSRARDLRCAARLRLPAGWRHGTALPAARESEGVIEFAPTTLETLVDSPVLAGTHFRTIPITPAAGGGDGDGSASGDAAGGDAPPLHFVHLAADGAAALEVKDETVAAWKRLVSEADALFGARHYRRYHFLVALSDGLTHGGLEHHGSSDNRLPERALVDDALRDAWAVLLPHEYVHSWCGKHRRPASMAADDFQAPTRGDLLWVYEGLTHYLCHVLAARCGLLGDEASRDALAMTAASMDHVPGRAWRPLSDTAVCAHHLVDGAGRWSSWRRGADFYEEGVLVWLEADAIVRQATGGKRSLDDFCRAFFGGEAGPAPAGDAAAAAAGPRVRTFTLDDVVAALRSAAPHDWAGFLDERLHGTDARAPLGGIERGGWKLVYRPEPSRWFRGAEGAGKSVDLAYSLGLRLGPDGSVADVIDGLPAARAGLAPGMKLLAVNGRRYSADLLRRAVKDTKAEGDASAAASAGTPLELIAENDQYVRTFRLDYRGGERYPHLERDESKPDLLTAILSPRTKPPATRPAQPATPPAAQPAAVPAAATP